MMKSSDVMITTGHSFDGYEVSKYIGLVSGETALGTGMFSEYSSAIADFFGVESSDFSNKLVQAKNASIQKLLAEVISLGGNAVIGVDIDYHAFVGNIIGVIASGTAVLLKEVSNTHVVFANNIPAINYNLTSPIRPLNSKIRQFDNNFIELETWFKKYNEESVEYLQCQIILLTVFGDEIDIGKKSLKVTHPTNTTKNIFTKITIPQIEDIQIVDRAKVVIGKIYSENRTLEIDVEKEQVLSIKEIEELRSGYASDTVTKARLEEDHWICSCGTANAIGERCSLCNRSMETTVSFSLENFISEAEQLSSSTEIFRFFKSLELNNDDLLLQIETLLNTNTILEKTYKNTKKDTILQLKRLLP